MKNFGEEIFSILLELLLNLALLNSKTELLGFANWITIAHSLAWYP
jgi:hypothetical protein